MKSCRKFWTMRYNCQGPIGAGGCPWENQGTSHHLSQEQGRRAHLGNPALVTMPFPEERPKLGQDVSLWMGVRIWAQTEPQDGCTGPWGRVKARLRCSPAGSGVPWLGRAELWGAGDQPCYSLTGVRADGPGGLKWGIETWTG